MYKKSRITPCVAALGAALASPAAAELKYDNQSGGHVLLYGQLNPAMQSVDDGQQTFTNLVDSAHSNSRVGIWVRQPTGAGMFTFNFETALGFRQSNLMSQNFKPDGWNFQRTSIRHIDFALNTENAGKFSIGQGSVASDGVAQSDLSGTTLVNYVAIGDTAGGYRFRTTAGALTGPTIGAAAPDFDGARRGRIRYDSPSFSGFKISASYGKEILVKKSDLKVGDIALRYEGDFGQVKMKGAIAYAEVRPTTGQILKDTIGSFSLLHDSGFNVTFAAGNRKNAGSYGYGKLGYIAKWFAVGPTAMSIDYYNGTDMAGLAGSKTKVWGLGLVQNFEQAKVDAYLGLRQYERTEVAATYQDMSSVLFGARWRF